METLKLLESAVLLIIRKIKGVINPVILLNDHHILFIIYMTLFTTKELNDIYNYKLVIKNTV